MHDWDESLPSHSVFVPTEGRKADNKKRSNSTPKPFLRKGSRKEPSALNRRGASSSPVTDRTKAEQSGKVLPHTMRHHLSDANKIDNHSQQYALEDNERVDFRMEDDSKAHENPGINCQNRLLPDTYEDELNISIMSSSTLCFGDTSTVDLHKRWTQEQLRTQVETDEFVKIEQELDNMTVTPILMTSTEKAYGEAFPTVSNISENVDKTFSLRESMENEDRPLTIGFENDRNLVSSEYISPPDKYEHDEDFDEQRTNEGTWIDQPASFFMENECDDISSTLDMGNSCGVGDRHGYNLRTSKHSNLTSAMTESQPDSTSHRPVTHIAIRQVTDSSKYIIDTDAEKALSRDFDHVNLQSSSTPRGLIANSTLINAKNKAAARRQRLDDVTRENTIDQKLPYKDSPLSRHVDSQLGMAIPYTYDASVDRTFDSDMYEDESPSSVPNYVDSHSNHGPEEKSLFSSDIRNSVDSVDDSKNWGSHGLSVTETNNNNKDCASQRSFDSMTYSSSRSSADRSGAIGSHDSAGKRKFNNKEHLSRPGAASDSLSSSLNNIANRNSVSMKSMSARLARKSYTATDGKAIRPSSSGKTRSSSTGRAGLRTAGDKKMEQQEGVSILIDEKKISEKAAELERELEAYKRENENLKQVRIQQSKILQDMEQQRRELKEWIESEKKKTMDFCSESKEAAIRERRAAAKYARDARVAVDTGNSEPNRKERAEIEALQATIHKLKLDHDDALKKWKSNAARLQQKNKDNAKVVATLQERIAFLEANKPTQLKDKKSNSKKKSRDCGYTTASYAVEEGISSDMEILIEQYSSNTVASVESSTLGENIPSNHNILRNELSYTMKRDPYATGDTRSSDMIEYGTLDGIKGCEEYMNTVTLMNDDRSGRVDKIENTSSPNIRNGMEGSENRQYVFDGRVSGETLPSYDPTKYVDKEGGNVNFDEASSMMRESMNSVTTDVTSVSERDVTSVLGTKDVMHKQSASNRLSPKRITETRSDGVRVTKYNNGTVKEVFPGGRQQVLFLNGDTKITHIDGTVVYHYANAKTTHTTHMDGREVYEFPNNQVETHFPDGKKEILFPNKTKKTIYPNIYEESIFPDGIVVREYSDGRKDVIRP